MKKQISFAALTFIILFTACKKDKDAAATTDVFIAGTDVDTTSVNNQYAVVWKNGVATRQLTNTIYDIYSYAVAVSGNDVYSTGFENHAPRKLKVYKNGVEYYTFGNTDPVEGYAIAVSGTDGSQDAEAFGIALSGSDVYVAGYNGNEARLWKNGTVSSLNNAAGYRAIAVAVVGTDVYVLGNSSQSTPARIRLWKNGVSSDITNGNFTAVAGGITTSGTDVYITGYEMNAVTNGTAIAKFWKNGTPAIVSDRSHHALPTGIAVKGNDVYVVGEQRAGVLNYAMLWKNGTPTILGSRRSVATGIAVK